MKKSLWILSFLVVSSAIFTGCGKQNDNLQTTTACAAGQVNTVAGCSNGGSCTIPYTGQTGGLVNGTCQAISTVTTTGTTCAIPSYVYQSSVGACCPSGMPLNQQYISIYCTAPGNTQYGTGYSSNYGYATGTGYYWNGYSWVHY